MSSHFFWELPTRYDLDHPLVKRLWNSQPKLLGSLHELGREIDELSSGFLGHMRMNRVIHQRHKSEEIMRHHRKHVPGLVGNKTAARKVV